MKLRIILLLLVIGYFSFMQTVYAKQYKDLSHELDLCKGYINSKIISTLYRETPFYYQKILIIILQERQKCRKNKSNNHKKNK